MNLGGIKEFKEHLLSTSYYMTGGLLVLIIGIIIFVFIPSLTKIKTITKAIDRERMELEKLYTRGQVVHEVKIKLEQTKKDLPLLEATILKAGTELDWIKRVEALALGHSLEQRLNLGTAVQENGLSVIPFTMEIKGNWPDVLSYVRDLERFDWYMRITNFEIAQTKDDNFAPGGDGRVTALIRIDTFWH